MSHDTAFKCVDLQRFKAIKSYVLYLFFKKKQPAGRFLVENIGLEPMTPCVQGRCSKPTELIPRYLVHN